ncbi:hypothetical protein [Kibdelosporangium philippinense]|uniref:hypothetical protein n=1 Tax=Kibdelosporangium philippinense TaxID=211113 RepID=UPI003613E30B
MSIAAHRNSRLRACPPKSKISLCRTGHFGVPERWTRCSGTVDTVCRNGGHGG